MSGPPSKFILFVEGESEKRCLPAFIKKWLDPKTDRPVGIKPVVFDGWAGFRKDAAQKADLYLNGPESSRIIAVIGLLDLYGPDFLSAGSIKSRVAAGTDFFENQVQDERFKMFFAVHELEAWILAQPHILPAEVRRSLPNRKPEEINSQEPPGKLLQRLYREKLTRTFKKTVYTPDLFRRLDPTLAAQACPHLERMLESLRGLAARSAS